jgi:RP/EB family microtubule-associated protein
MGDPSNIGMMEGAFFIGRTELINWVNETLQLNVQKVEQCCTGAIYAQIIDAVHPGKVPMSKLKWAARTEPEYIHNFKVLQQALNALNVTRAVDVQKLVRGKYQDNLEMLQWFHCYYDRNGSAADYDPVRRRGNLPPGLPEWVRGTGMKENVQPQGTGIAKNAQPRPSYARGVGTSSQQVVREESKELTRTKEELDALKSTCQGLERERDFYFGKLRDIEIQCQEYESSGAPSGMTLDSFMKEVMKVLYATDEEDEVPAA